MYVLAWCCLLQHGLPLKILIRFFICISNLLVLMLLIWQMVRRNCLTFTSSLFNNLTSSKKFLMGYWGKEILIRINESEKKIFSSFASVLLPVKDVIIKTWTRQKLIAFYDWSKKKCRGIFDTTVSIFLNGRLQDISTRTFQPQFCCSPVISQFYVLKLFDIPM